jgi:indolepyruvate ferredoxin oxidoreductase
MQNAGKEIMTQIESTFEDRYTQKTGWVFLSGTQALVRLVLMQARRDAKAGLNTAGYVSGYRGSPLGGVDREFWRNEETLKRHSIVFQAGVNEDLAATAIWGTQQASFFDTPQKDGVFSLWYGKGPGVDRSGDVFRHANLAGTSPLGGVLALAGDDPVCTSSTVPSQSDHALIDARMPLLVPADVQDILDFGLYGLAMSRYSGCWVGLKTLTENMDSSGSVLIDDAQTKIVPPVDFQPPTDGLHIRRDDPPMDKERRLEEWKLPAAQAFARANKIDKIVHQHASARLGIVACGKSFLDVMEALDILGLSSGKAKDIPLRVYKIGLAWPLDREGLSGFCQGLDEIFVVEGKHVVLEGQIKEALFNHAQEERPQVTGKRDEKEREIFPSFGDLSPEEIALAIAKRLSRFHDTSVLEEPLAFLEAQNTIASKHQNILQRELFFCSGCPHNTSTNVPDGSFALAGIGCHFMASRMERNNIAATHMGGEGANWNGIAPFIEDAHAFANLGDGTYYHSGILALRAAVAAKVNITYKILYNDAVAMTGGQPMDGPLNVSMIANQIRAEGVERIAIVSDDIEKHKKSLSLPAATTLHPREELDALQQSLRHVPGVSALIYDQACAAETRRKRRKGQIPQATEKVFINTLLCDGCGDCAKQSNCIALTPEETPLGRKRSVDQSACNGDFSCLEGFCPALVTLRGATLKSPLPVDLNSSQIPEPDVCAIDRDYNILVSGIGGTGVLTIGAVLGTAAQMEERRISTLDLAGLAQKNGAVACHIRIAEKDHPVHAARIGAGRTNLLLGGDLVTSSNQSILSRLNPETSQAIVNDHQTMTGTFMRNPDMDFPKARLKDAISENSGPAFFDANHAATRLLGDPIFANMILLGFACQKGLLPLSYKSIEKAISLNGVAVSKNLSAFSQGRRLACDDAALNLFSKASDPQKPDYLDAFTKDQAKDLAAYQNDAYAKRYLDFVAQAKMREDALGKTGFALALARSYYHLLTYKDEYEVARLYSDGRFSDAVSQAFDGKSKTFFHLAPPLFAGKRRFGPWIGKAFPILAHFKGLRGTIFDPFGHQHLRLEERRLIVEYEELMAKVLKALNADNYAQGIELAKSFLSIRGFGPVKEGAILAARKEITELSAGF